MEAVDLPCPKPKDLRLDDCSPASGLSVNSEGNSNFNCSNHLNDNKSEEADLNQAPSFKWRNGPEKDLDQTANGSAP